MRKATAMVVAGVMSGTSADGVDVALVRISPQRRKSPKIEVLGHSEFPYPKAVREAVLRAASGEMKVAEVSRLHWTLGAVYAECVEKACAAAGARIGADNPTSQKQDVGHPILCLVGMHGQTIFHEAPRATWQIGEAAVVRERLGCPVVSDFRPADLAAGGQGAPLVPMLDYCMFRSAKVTRVLLNLGGIANMTVIPAGGGLEDVIAFDTGPGNMVIDQVMQREFGKPFDRGGSTGLKGKPLLRVVSLMQRDGFFRKVPPKSCGREQFGEVYAERLIRLCKEKGATPADIVATAAELTALSVVTAYQRFGNRKWIGQKVEVIAAGGGVRNALVMKRLRLNFAPVGISVKTMEEFGVQPQAKEAVAFALLGWLSWHGMAGNVPSATGARRGVVLGKISW